MRLSLLQLELVQQTVEDGSLVLDKQHEPDEDGSTAEGTTSKPARVRSSLRTYQINTKELRSVCNV
jgi:hypothetical protein